MKFRTDFVTNSSSSSFSVVLAVYDKKGHKYSFAQTPDEMNPDGGGSCSFNANLEALTLSEFKNVESLATYLAKAVQYDDYYDEGEDTDTKANTDWYYEDGDPDLTSDDDSVHDSYYIDYYRGEDEHEYARCCFDMWDERKSYFIKDVKNHISSLDDIAKISVTGLYSAWGEQADLVPENDEMLCELSQRVMNAKAEEKDGVLREMLDYIRHPNAECTDYDYHGFEQNPSMSDEEDFAMYKENLISLAKKLCGDCGPDSVAAITVEEKDFVQNSYTASSKFDLTRYIDHPVSDRYYCELGVHRVYVAHPVSGFTYYSCEFVNPVIDQDIEKAKAEFDVNDYHNFYVDVPYDSPDPHGVFVVKNYGLGNLNGCSETLLHILLNHCTAGKEQLRELFFGHRDEIISAYQKIDGSACKDYEIAYTDGETGAEGYDFSFLPNKGYTAKTRVCFGGW